MFYYFYLIIILVACLLIYAIARISPYEDKEKFTLFNTMWFTASFLFRLFYILF